MVQRRTPRPAARVIPHVFDIPEGLEDLVHDDDSEELDEQGDIDDFDEPNDPTKKKRKKKKKKKRKKKKRKGKKKKDKKKGKGKGKKKDKGKDKERDKRPNTPSSLEVVKQVIRTKKDGSQVVDLTVDVDRIGRADKYEFRVTKKDTGKTTVING